MSARFGGRALAPEREPAPGPLRLQHTLPVNDKIEQRRLGGNRQGLGPRLPDKSAAQHVSARRQTHIGHVAAGYQRRRSTVERYGLRPALDIARQSNPALGVDLPALAEGTAVCVDVEQQALRPYAAV